jgi:hypothetical protein
MSQNYRSDAQKDALEFAEFICRQGIYLSHAQYLLLIESDGSINPNPETGFWPESAETPTGLLKHLRKAGLTGQVLVSALPEDDGYFFGIEIQVEDSGFYPLLPNPVVSSYSPTGYLIAGKLVRIPRDPHPGRYYFPKVISAG